MAKKKFNRSPAQIWSDEDQAILLAWLDYTLQHPQVQFKETVLGRLNDRYTFEKVEGKLQRLWYSYCHEDAPAGTKGIDYIYAHGSKSLGGLSEFDKEQIANTLDHFEQNFPAIQEAATSQSNRRLRSASRFDSKAPDASASPSTVCDGNERSQRQHKPTPLSLLKTTEEINYARRASTTQQPNDRKRKWTTYETDLCTETIRDTRTGPKQPVSPATPNNRHLNRSREQSDAICTRSATSIHDSQESPLEAADEDLNKKTRPKRSLSQSPDSNANQASQAQQQHPIENRIEDDRPEEIIRCVCGITEEPEGGNSGWISCDECKVWQHTLCVKYSCEQCLPTPTLIRKQTNSGTQTSIPSIEDDYCDERLNRALDEIGALKSILAEKDEKVLAQERDVEYLERKISAMEGARKRRDEEYGSPVEVEMAKLLAEREELQRELGDRTELGTFTKLTGKCQYSSETIDIVSSFDVIYGHRDRSLGGMDERKIFPVLQLDQYGDLRDLVRSAIGAPYEDENIALEAKLASKLLKTSSQAVLKALMTSALRQWVFYADFPSFDGDASPTLRVYRENIARLDGSVALRNLDLATMHNLIGGPILQEQIAQESKRLANRLSVTLAPLFTEVQVPSLSTPMAWGGFATWQSDVGDVEDRRYHLTEMFADALRAKARSCLNVEWYEMVIYAPGTKFDPKTMTVQTMDGMNVSIQTHKSREVHMCVEAALFTFPREELSDGDNISDCVMSGKNFKTQQRRDFHPLMKAVVILS